MLGIRSMLLLVLFTSYEGAVAQVNDPDGAEQKTVQIVRTDTAPIIDGRLDEDVWLRAALVDDLHAVSPIEYAEPSEQTRVYLLYTEDALYVGARLSDSEPDAINAKILRQGESVFGDDFFAIVLDPFHDRRSGFRFEVNANGIRSDLLYQNTNQQLRDWDGIWEAAATQDEQGWTAEMSIPFQTLSFDPNNEVWGVNFMRFIPRRNEFIGWVSRNRTMNPSITGTVTGFNNL
ncbi:MAG: carbohydrate binding family 9 domain-containing protein, partial [Gammaproteobacteria bacterium]